MRRGTTPTHIFTLPFDVSIITDVRVIYSQEKVVKIRRKGIEECSMVGNDITLKLTREETMKLNSSKLVNIQLEIWTLGNDVMVSDPILKSIDECFDDEV